MICGSLTCCQHQSQYDTLSVPLKNLLLYSSCNSKSQHWDNFSSSQILKLGNPQLYSKSSIQSKSQHSSSNSTMVNTEDLPSKSAKMHVKKITDKISITDLRKIQTLKKIPLLSKSSSVQKIDFDSDINSIIDKLQNMEMEEKIDLNPDLNTPSTDKTEIFLPQPKHFLMKWKKQ